MRGIKALSFNPALVANDSIRRQETACNGLPHCLAVRSERPVSKKWIAGYVLALILSHFDPSSKTSQRS